MQAVIGLLSRFKPGDGIIRQEVAGSLLLFNMEDGRYYSLNEVGRRIWDLCDGTRTLSDIALDLCNEYDSPQTMIRDDVLEIVGDLAHACLLVPVADAF